MPCNFSLVLDFECPSYVCAALQSDIVSHAFQRCQFNWNSLIVCVVLFVPVVDAVQAVVWFVVVL